MSNPFEIVILDIEANGLPDTMIDFSRRPLVLKDTAKLWCIVLRDHITKEKKSFALNECTKENLKEALSNLKELVFHNGIKYDAPILQLFGVLDYTVAYPGQSSTVFGKEVILTDTLIWSKLLNQDRFGGHALEAWGKRAGNYKTDFREVCIQKGYIDKSSPKGTEFLAYYPETLTYCEQDTSATSSTYNMLMTEKGDWDWQRAYEMELKIADLTFKQELFGFNFDLDLAKECIEDLSNKLNTIADKVNPLLPPKLLSKGEQKEYTPPKNQFKKDLSLSAHMINFVKRLDARIEQRGEENYLLFEDREYLLPYHECVKESIDSDIDDLDNLKAYLLDLGWIPMEWKERDLTKDAKKQKLEGDKLLQTIQRYVDNTLNGPYRKYRLEILGIEDAEDLQSILESKIGGFGIKVPVSPSIRIGTEKKLCPNLKLLGEKADFAFDVTQYLTYKHRKNSIAGGKEDEDGEPLSGFVSMVREDGRISTPADTLGANGGRYKHRGVNVIF